MMKVQLKINDAVFFNGKVYSITGTQGIGRWVIYDKNAPYSSAFSVAKEAVQPVASEIFKVGDRVQSIFGGFIGYVMGFEHGTNRVVCRSQHNEEKDRRRFSYTVAELNILPEEPAFKVNKVVKIKVGNEPAVPVRPLKLQGDADMVILYRCDNGIGMGAFPADILVGDLEDLGIKIL